MKTVGVLVLLAGVAQGFVPTSVAPTRCAPIHMTASDSSERKMGPFRAMTDLVLRSGVMASAIFGGSFAGMMADSVAPAPAQAAIVNLPRCEGGLGDGCEAMSASEGELVKMLQARSAKNYESSKRQKLINYNYNNFKDYFSFKGQVLVIRPDGRFIAIEKKVYDKLSREGKVEGKNWVSSEEPPVDGTVDFIPGGGNSSPIPE